jgi:hypothetical protein
MGAAYQASFAAGPRPDYGDDGGLGAGAIAGIAAGAGLAALGLFGGGAAVVGGAFLAGSDHECRERYPILPENQTEIADLRLVPANSRLDQGYCRCFHLEAKSAADRKWYSVTHRAESVLEVRDRTDALVKQEGSKNIFCVPMTAPQSANGQSIIIEGRFAPAGAAQVRTAEARVQVRIPGRLEERRPQLNPAD